MGDGESFRDLLSRVRSGDPDAASEIVARYESAIRVALRTRMSDPVLRRQFDSVDVSQSVLKSFFLRMAAGLYDLDEPGQLVALLTAMARRKFAMRVRYEKRLRRDLRRSTSLRASHLQLQSDVLNPSELAMNSELVERAYELMDHEVRMIFDQRAKNTTWVEIAALLGGTPEGRRKQYERALDRIAIVFGIEEEPGEQSPSSLPV